MAEAHDGSTRQQERKISLANHSSPKLERRRVKEGCEVGLFDQDRREVVGDFFKRRGQLCCVVSVKMLPTADVRYALHR